MNGYPIERGAECFENHMQVNLYTPHYLSNYFGRIMRDAGKGHIFIITSIASREPVRRPATYTITKFALRDYKSFERRVA